MRILLRKFCRLHWLLVIILFALIAWGVWAIYNASSFREGLHLSGMWRDQLRWLAFGIAIWVVTALIDYKWLRWGGWLLYAGGLGALLFQSHVNIQGCGARSAISVGFSSLSTPQLALAMTAVALAVGLGHLHQAVSLFRYQWLRIVLVVVLALIPVRMLYGLPDLGAAWTMGLVLVLMLLVASIRGRYLVLMLAVGLCLVPLWYHFCLKPFQQKRVDVMVQMMTSPSLEVRGEAYMSDKLKVAVGSAGFTGKGPLSSKVEGRSVHRTYFTPTEAINDFIFAVIVEEFGLLGGLLQMTLFLLLFLLCIHVAYTARDELGRMLVVGVVALLFVCSLQNMAMNICMFPITGQSLPFTSYGGIYLTLCMFMMGLAQSVWIHRHDVAPVPPPPPSPEAAAENLPPPSQPEELPRLDG
ncbi:FtsW/RodA/SpoVE family cell cycle protein [Verrucomicrobium sp. BvORR106]|uniref:FtsW/RodA/SpoVE family cell cycle protein n=1 Tax=Verrucomicrobium sp. BvORR106 TaxID=1403819 RepID=UPI0009DC9A12|nr:FtsW/RodA/SpoVE family cell cycle protein [Verrucomicrobium sp. BvORR106]